MVNVNEGPSQYLETTAKEKPVVVVVFPEMERTDVQFATLWPFIYSNTSLSLSQGSVRVG